MSRGTSVPLRIARSWSGKLMVAAALSVLAGPEVLACSGPGAVQVMRESQMIGWAFAAASLVMIAVASVPLSRHGKGTAATGLVGLLVIHPGFWMRVNSGDCGYGLRAFSFLMTVVLGLGLGLAFAWPNTPEGKARKWRWVVSGSLLGALVGLLVLFLTMAGPGPASGETVFFAVCTFLSVIATGALLGAGGFTSRGRPWYRPRFRVRTLLLAPVLLAPMLVLLLPVLPYEASVSTTNPFHFLVIDERTRQPVASAVVRLTDPRFAPGDADHQPDPAVTGSDGRAEYFLFANVTGREGLLGRTGTTTYDPWLVRVEADGYAPFVAPLCPGAMPRPEGLTAQPIGLTFPPPPSLAIALKRKMPVEIAQ